MRYYYITILAQRQLFLFEVHILITKTQWPQSASELYRPSDRRLSAKLVPTFAWSAQRIPTSVNPGFLDRSRYSFIQVAPQLSSWGWVDPVPDPLLLRKLGRAGNRTRNLWICSQKLWPLDHRGGPHLNKGRYKRKDNFNKFQKCYWQKWKILWT
jgi:hypothetical protein